MVLPLLLLLPLVVLKRGPSRTRARREREKKEADRRFCCFGPENVWAHNKASTGEEQEWGVGREGVRLVMTGKGQRRLAMILHNYKTARTTLAEKKQR